MKKECGDWLVGWLIRQLIDSIAVVHFISFAIERGS